jgi:hypothetical protein
MQSIAFALPLLPGKYEEGMQFIRELTSEQSQQHHDQRRQQGYHAVKIWRQTTPEEMIVVYLEAENLKEAMQSRVGSDHSFEQWYQDKIQEITGHHLDQVQGQGAPAEQLVDWHREHGHRQTHS